uniref:Uncharacterized protein n=1 Tax=Compsopogon caeruleus TaxID=31354 RepID=A0A6T6AD50_9RHOD|mmetsp:Transcript_10081/g.20386  ORF Transcript_10081/g.20386 Transcript_10081/m.20386 type:complete len:162 (+) Transcript_10081:153-638(+)
MGSRRRIRLEGLIGAPRPSVGSVREGGGEDRRGGAAILRNLQSNDRVGDGRRQEYRGESNVGQVEESLQRAGSDRFPQFDHVLPVIEEEKEGVNLERNPSRGASLSGGSAVDLFVEDEWSSERLALDRRQRYMEWMRSTMGPHRGAPIFSPRSCNRDNSSW